MLKSSKQKEQPILLKISYWLFFLLLRF